MAKNEAMKMMMGSTWKAKMTPKRAGLAVPSVPEDETSLPASA